MSLKGRVRRLEETVRPNRVIRTFLDLIRWADNGDADQAPVFAPHFEELLKGAGGKPKRDRFIRAGSRP